MREIRTYWGRPAKEVRLVVPKSRSVLFPLVSWEEAIICLVNEQGPWRFVDEGLAVLARKTLIHCLECLSQKLAKSGANIKNTDASRPNKELHEGAFPGLARSSAPRYVIVGRHKRLVHRMAGAVQAFLPRQENDLPANHAIARFLYRRPSCLHALHVHAVYDNNFQSGPLQR